MNIQKAASILVKQKRADAEAGILSEMTKAMAPGQRTSFGTEMLDTYNSHTKEMRVPSAYDYALGRMGVNNKMRGLLGGIQNNEPAVIDSLNDPAKQQQFQSILSLNPKLTNTALQAGKDILNPPIPLPKIEQAMQPVHDFTPNLDIAKTASIIGSIGKGIKAINPFKPSSKPAPIPQFGGEPAKPAPTPKLVAPVQAPAPIQQQPVQQQMEQPQRLSQQSRRNVMSGITYQPQQPVITDNGFDAARAADVLTRNVPVVPNTPNNPNVIQTPIGNIDKRNMPDAINKLMPDEIGAQGASWKLPDSNSTFNVEPAKNGLGASLAFNSKF